MVEWRKYTKNWGGGEGELKPISPSCPSTAYVGFLGSFLRYSFIDASMNDRIGYVRTCICNDVCSTNDAAFFSDAERERILWDSNARSSEYQSDTLTNKPRAPQKRSNKLAEFQLIFSLS